MSIGSTEAFLSGHRPKQLSLEKMDKYELKLLEGSTDILVCDVFYDKGESSEVSRVYDFRVVNAQLDSDIVYQYDTAAGQLKV